MLTELKKSTQQIAADLSVYFHYFEIKDVLDHVVSEWIAHKNLRVIGNFHSKSHPLLLVCPINTFLHDTATMLMACDLTTLAYHSLVDELFVVFLPSLKDLLDNVVAIDVFREQSDLA